jgi:DNA-directed RNA polymerase specialized sigma24 family protein
MRKLLGQSNTEREDWDLFFRSEWGTAHAIARKVLRQIDPSGHLAEQIASDAFLETWRYLGGQQFDEDQAKRNLYMRAKHRSISLLHKLNIKPELFDDAEVARLVERRGTDFDTYIAIREAASKLSEARFHLLLLATEGYSFQEMAGILGPIFGKRFASERSVEYQRQLAVDDFERNLKERS